MFKREGIRCLGMPSVQIKKIMRSHGSGFFSLCGEANKKLPNFELICQLPYSFTPIQICWGDFLTHPPTSYKSLFSPKLHHTHSLAIAKVWAFGKMNSNKRSLLSILLLLLALFLLLSCLSSVEGARLVRDPARGFTMARAHAGPSRRGPGHRL